MLLGKAFILFFGWRRLVRVSRAKLFALLKGVGTPEETSRLLLTVRKKTVTVTWKAVLKTDVSGHLDNVCGYC